MSTRLVVGIVVGGCALASAMGCASDEGAQGTSAEAEEKQPGEGAGELTDEVDGAPSPASRLSVRPVAVRNVTTADEKIDRRLTSLVTLAISRTSGAPVIAEHAADASIQNCKDPESGCQTPIMNDFLRATWIVHVRVDRLGEAYYASGSVWQNASPLKRISTQAQAREQAGLEFGWKIGEALRPLLEQEVAQQ